MTLALYLRPNGMFKPRSRGKAYRAVMEDLQATAGRNCQASGGVRFREGNDADSEKGSMRRARQRDQRFMHSRICPTATNTTPNRYWMEKWP